MRWNPYLPSSQGLIGYILDWLVSKLTVPHDHNEFVSRSDAATVYYSLGGPMGVRNRGEFGVREISRDWTVNDRKLSKTVLRTYIEITRTSNYRTASTGVLLVVSTTAAANCRRSPRRSRTCASPGGSTSSTTPSPLPASQYWTRRCPSRKGRRPRRGRRPRTKRGDDARCGPGRPRAVRRPADREVRGGTQDLPRVGRRHCRNRGDASGSGRGGDSSVLDARGTAEGRRSTPHKLARSARGV